MDLFAQMSTFTRVVEVGSLSRAARAQRLSLAAVSRQVSALETSLGAALLVRTTRKVTITEAGRRYYEHCLRVLREVDAAHTSVRTDHAVEGLLSVTVPVTLGLLRVSPHLPALLAKHRRLSIDLRVEDRVIDLVGEGVDVAIRAGSSMPENPLFLSRLLTSYRRVLVASPAYTKSRGEPRAPEALSRHDALVHLGAFGATTTWHFLQNGAETTVAVRGTFRSNAPYVLQDAARSGLGVALLPEWLVADDVRDGRLKVLLRAWEVAPVSVSGVYRTELRSSARVKVLLDHLAERYAVESSGLL